MLMDVKIISVRTMYLAFFYRINLIYMIPAYWFKELDDIWLLSRYRKSKVESYIPSLLRYFFLYTAKLRVILRPTIILPI